MEAHTITTSLSPGTLIGRYEVCEVLGIGGFGITYKTRDTKLNRLVAMKEYLPADVATRAQDSNQVNAYENRGDEYQYGLVRFLDEAKTLAKFHHINIIGILDHFELNNTAYLIMTYEKGQTLGEKLKQQGGKLSEQELRVIIKSILKGLQHIHEQDYYHRDIKPGNIYIRKQGELVLIDFGAARQAVGARSRSLTNIVSVGYAPSEQYGSNKSKQGAWSDLYAVGATMYRCISGEIPTDAPTRSSEILEGDPDPLVSALIIGQGYYSRELLELIDWMLVPTVKKRPQSAAQVLNKLEQNSVGGSSSTQSNQEELVTVIAVDQPVWRASNTEQENSFIKSRLGLIIAGLSFIMITGVAVSQKEVLQQWIRGEAFKTEIKQELKEDLPVQVPPVAKKAELVTAAAKLEDEEKNMDMEKEREDNGRQEEGVEQSNLLILEQQKIIQSLLDAAEINIGQLYLSSPKGNNAIEKYQQVLQLDADNNPAQQGLTIIIDKYLTMAKLSQQRNNYAKARRQLQKAENINADDPKLVLARQDLNIAQQTYKEEQTYRDNEFLGTEARGTNNISIAMVRIKPGCFQMGSHDGSSDEAIHRVCLTRSYQLGKYEVTQEQWQKVMGSNPSRFKNNSKPVEQVSWNEVQSFIRKLNQQTAQNYRLPTEAEWEYACRSRGKNQRYCGSDRISNVAWYDNNSGSTTHHIGQKQPNDLGLYDMSGNVYEWVQDKYNQHYYKNSFTNDPKGSSVGSHRVYRGGSWSYSASLASATFRSSISPSYSDSNLGFRLARTR